MTLAEHFAEHPAADVHCRSWMLDARIPDLLPGSNLAWFQQRWRTYGMPGLGDEDALFREGGSVYDSVTVTGRETEPLHVILSGS